MANKRFTPSARFLVLLAALIGGTIGILLFKFLSIPSWLGTSTTAITRAGDTASFVPPPQSRAELIDKAAVIVVGTVGPIVNQGTFSGYDAAGKVIQSGAGNSPGIPITDYEIKIERVLRADKTIQAGKPLVLRMLGTPVSTKAERAVDGLLYFPMSYTGERYLFFLSKNPDGKTYGFYYGPWSRLIIDGSVVTASNGERTPVQFDGHPVAPVEFLDIINQAAQK